MLKGLGKYSVQASKTGARSFSVQANLTGPSGGTAAKSFLKPTDSDVLSGLVGGGEREIRALCRDCYYHDAVSGSVVDLMCQMPFGDFSLSGVPETSILEVFRSSLEKIRVKTLFPSLSVSYQVMGAFLGVLSYDPENKIFDNIMPQSLDNAEIKPVPVFGHTPYVELKISKEIAEAVKFMTDPRAKSFVGNLPDIIKKANKEGKIPLSPENTLYIPRKTFADEFVGVSIFRRILPTFLLEKALLRGTIELSYRRQRGIIHGMAGDDNWMPTNEELGELAELITGADQDPVGAVLVTRPGVQFQEIATPGDAWRWTDSIDILNAQKFRGLGVSEALISGETTIQGTQAGMTVFVQQMRYFREYVTRAALYEKVFPYLSVINDFRRMDNEVYGGYTDKPPIRGNRELGYSVVCGDGKDNPSLEGTSLADYHVPVVTWHSALRPEGDMEYVQTLDTLTQHGVPVPLRMLAAACGSSLQDILYGMDEDLEVRKKIADYNKKIAESQGQGDDYGGFQGASAEIPLGKRELPKGLLSRDYGDLAERLNPNLGGGGKRLPSSPRGYKEREEKANKIIAQAAAEISRQVNWCNKNNKEFNPYPDRVINGPYGRIK